MKAKNRCLPFEEKSVPAKMNSRNERMRTVNFYSL
jgi:hypothetical protein